MNIDLDDVRIRQAITADAFLLAEHRNRFLEELLKNGKQDLKITEKNNLEYFKRKLQDGTYLGFIADLNGNQIASAGMLLNEYPQKGIEKKRITATVLSVYTHPEYRKYGISSKLVSEMVSHARKTGISKLELLATKEGEGVYKKNGFSEPDEKYLHLLL